MSERAPGRRLGVGIFKQDGLYHGYLEVDGVSPSGSVRPRIILSTTEGYTVATEARDLICHVVPDMEPPSVEGLADLAPLPDLNANFGVTVATPQEGGAKTYEVRNSQMALDDEMIERLIACGRLTIESSSGNDPHLSCRYDHYVVVPNMPAPLAFGQMGQVI